MEKQKIGGFGDELILNMPMSNREDLRYKGKTHHGLDKGGYN